MKMAPLRDFAFAVGVMFAQQGIESVTVETTKPRIVPSTIRPLRFPIRDKKTDMIYRS
jgi:hypothetical protein